MKVNMPETIQTPAGAANAKPVKSLDDRLNKTSSADEMSPAMSMYYQEYMQNILMSDGSDPDNQPDW